MALTAVDRRPMLASTAVVSLVDPHFVYEPKYDGIRILADITPSPRSLVTLWSRRGNEKNGQFPEIVEALGSWALGLKEPVVLDGEIVALDARGEPAGFERLQGRINLKIGGGLAGGTRSRAAKVDVAFIAFDILRVGPHDLRDRPLVERRAELDRVFGRTGSPLLRVSELARGDGRGLCGRAVAQGWEGLIAKRADSRYRSGRRTPDWCKLRIHRAQEFVIGGWTESRRTRVGFGALLLGIYAGGHLVYAGRVGTGFDEREMGRIIGLLEPLEIRASPFREPPASKERPHWVRPKLVAQVKFTEWTAAGVLRQPVYLGLRDDKDPADVRREEKVQGSLDTQHPAPSTRQLLDQLHAFEDARREGALMLPGGDRLLVNNLHKVFWPKSKLTKGDLLRYYVQVAPFILPAVADRPLVMKRFPNGIGGKAFYQQRAPKEVPEGVRIETIAHDRDVPARLVGGNLKTLLYMAQLATISQDPWFARVGSPETPDYVAFDLDPMPGVGFARVLDVARWVHDELVALGAVGFPKTSGADGVHIYVPLPRGTPYQAGLLFSQILATIVAHKHPGAATVERVVGARGPRVYIDCLQNVPGKTLAAAYSARASEWAGVSAPLTWGEVHEGVEREDFTIQSMPTRLDQVGDLWKALRVAKGVDLGRVERYAARTMRKQGEGGGRHAE